MKKKVGYLITVVVMLCVLGGLVGLFLHQTTKANTPQQEEAPLPTAQVARGSVIDEVSGSGELKSGVTEKLKMAKWRYFKALVAPLDQRIPAGTPLVEYTNGESLVAPYDLVVLSSNVPEKKNEELTVDHYIEVSRLDLMHMEIAVHENDISRLAVGQSAQVTLGSDETKTYDGTISKIAQVGSYEATGSKYTVTVEFSNDQVSMIGMSATVKIVVGEATDVLVVPVSSVNDSPEGSFLMVKLSKDMKRVPVETGLSDTAMVEVRGDIAEGDKVVLNETTNSGEISAIGVMTGASSVASDGIPFGSVG